MSELLALSLPEDAEALAALPPPEESGLASAKPAQLEALVRHCQGLWKRLFTEERWQPAGNPLPERPDLNTYEGGFWRVLRMVGSYYGAALIRLTVETGVEARRLLSDQSQEPLRARDEKSLDEVDDELSRMTAMVAVRVFEVCVLALVVSMKVDEMQFQPGDLTDDYDADLIALDAFEKFRARSPEGGGDLGALVDYLFGLALDYRKQIVVKRAGHRRDAMQESVSHVSPRELKLLSRRQQLMVQKYGAKRVERVFEQRLAILFQSFGFTVVPVGPGVVGADLLCISREPRWAFLVDAKSSAGAYALPKADQRAIRDYVREFSADLPDLPPLSFVLLVGSEAAGTVEGKLERLRVEAGVPVRFVPAEVLANIREELAGPLVSRSFRDAVLDGGPVLDETLARRSKEAVDRIASAYSSFVDELKSVSTP